MKAKFYVHKYIISPSLTKVEWAEKIGVSLSSINQRVLRGVLYRDPVKHKTNPTPRGAGVKFQ